MELIVLIAILPYKVLGWQAQVGGAAQHGLQVAVKHRRGLGRRGFWHGVLRHDAVFFHQGDEHGPLAAVIDGIIHELGYGAVRNIAVLKLSHGGKEPIGLFQLVKEINIGLRELKILELGLVH